MEYRQIKYEDRIKIQALLSLSFSFSAIGEVIDKDPTSVSREVKRNSVSNKYDAKTAHRLYCARKAANAKRSFTDFRLRFLVRLLLFMFWSPEQISGRLKLFSINVSHETIYKWIYSQLENGVNLLQYLRINKKNNRRGSKYRKRASDGSKKSIHDRPVEVNEKLRIGDWEGDTIEGKKNSGFIATFVERKSMVVVAAKMSNKCANTFNKATAHAFSSIDDVFTITLDNGTEMSAYRDIEDFLDCDIYFADPGNPGQRGLNENTNGLLRQAFPKGEDFTKISQKHIDKMVYMMNNRPRKNLGYRTPLETYYNLKPLDLIPALRI